MIGIALPKITTWNKVYLFYSDCGTMWIYIYFLIRLNCICTFIIYIIMYAWIMLWSSNNSKNRVIKDHLYMNIRFNLAFCFVWLWGPHLAVLKEFLQGLPFESSRNCIWHQNWRWNSYMLHSVPGLNMSLLWAYYACSQALWAISMTPVLEFSCLSALVQVIQTLGDLVLSQMCDGIIFSFLLPSPLHQLTQKANNGMYNT